MKDYWWQDAVVYQVYPRSFYDSNGDGIGDLQGVVSKLDYIKSLGVDAIWLNPFFKSPNEDGGYDISDYFEVQPEFGTLADFDNLLEAAHQRGLGVIIDLVFNHTSDEHDWFRQSRLSSDNNYRDYYFWHKGRDGGPPSNWPSFFGGSAWQLDQLTGQYYLHFFSRKQPDLNWENPQVREALHKVLRFWIEKGVDGIRLDAISLISKRISFPDSDTTDFNQVIARYYSNGPRLQEWITEMREKVFTTRKVLAVGEGPGIDPMNAKDYLHPQKGLDMLFHFGYMFLDQGPGGRFDPVPWSLDRFRALILEWDRALYPGGWGSIFLGNHDFPRQVSRWGDDGEFHQASAKALLTLVLTLRGTPFIFAGDEIGMTNLRLDSISESRDVETINAFHKAHKGGMSEEEFLSKANYTGRDNARTPFQWDSGPHAGFSTAKPWMKVNPNKSAINASIQEDDPGSILNYFRKVVALRKAEKALVYSEFSMLEVYGLPLIAYDRWKGDVRYRIIVNFSSKEQQIPFDCSGHEVLLSNYGHTLLEKFLPWHAVVLRVSISGS